MRLNKPELPFAFTNKHNRGVFSTIQAQHVAQSCTALLLSYKATPRRIVNVISTQHKKSAIQSGRKALPEVIAYYNSTKGGVDAADERVSTYTTKYKSNRWHIAFFCNILDLSALNAFVIHQAFNPGWNENKLYRRRLFLLELGNSLCHLHRNRASIPNSVTSIHPVSSPSQKRGRCGECSSPNKKRCTVRCSKCQAFTCKDHLISVCLSCCK